jgi:hypothetical protein
MDGPDAVADFVEIEPFAGAGGAHVDGPMEDLPEAVVLSPTLPVSPVFPAYPVCTLDRIII